MLSTSSKGLSATISAKAPWFFQLRFKDIVSNHEHRQGKFQICIRVGIVRLTLTPISKERYCESHCSPRALISVALSAVSPNFSSTNFHQLLQRANLCRRTSMLDLSVL